MVKKNEIASKSIETYTNKLGNDSAPVVGGTYMYVKNEQIELNIDNQ